MRYFQASSMRRRYTVRRAKHQKPSPDSFLLQQDDEAVIRNMCTTDDSCSDSTILAVMSLACHHFRDAVSANGSTQGPKQGPLQSLRRLHLYGATGIRESVNSRGLELIIEQRGGIEAISIPGVCSGQFLVSLKRCPLPTLIE